jgi:hypothetical protein
MRYDDVYLGNNNKHIVIINNIRYNLYTLLYALLCNIAKDIFCWFVN